MKRHTTKAVSRATRTLSAGVAALALTLGAPSSALADDVAPADTPTESGPVVVTKTPVEPAPNIIQVELSTGALIGISLAAVSVSYERMFGEHISVRLGYGMVGGRRDKFGLGGGDRTQITGHGGYAMVHAMLGDAHKLELGAGVGVVFNHRETNHADGSASESDGTLIAPQASVAYRYQPEGSGIFFRAGFVWTLGWGTPLGIGLGYSF